MTIWRSISGTTSKDRLATQNGSLAQHGRGFAVFAGKHRRGRSLCCWSEEDPSRPSAAPAVPGLSSAAPAIEQQPREGAVPGAAEEGQQRVCDEADERVEAFAFGVGIPGDDAMSVLQSTTSFYFILFYLTTFIHYSRRESFSSFFLFHMSTMEWVLRPCFWFRPVYMVLMGGYKWAMMSLCIIRDDGFGVGYLCCRALSRGLIGLDDDLVESLCLFSCWVRRL